MKEKRKESILARKRISIKAFSAIHLRELLRPFSVKGAYRVFSLAPEDACSKTKETKNGTKVEMGVLKTREEGILNDDRGDSMEGGQRL